MFSSKKNSLQQVVIADMVESLNLYKLWFNLGWIDIQQRYRGSILGPLWITLSMVVFITALSIVYTRLFHQDIRTFMPFLTVGMLLWGFISAVLIESTDVFINSKNLIESIRLPYFTYIFRLIWRNHIIFLHNFVVFVLVALIFKVGVNKNILFFIPGFIIVSVLLTGICAIIGLLGARFRDIPPVISSVIMIVFFISPVTWQADMLGKHSLIIILNPLYYILDLLRSPLLGIAPYWESWVVCLLLSFFSVIMSSILFGRFRSRIAFWV